MQGECDHGEVSTVQAAGVAGAGAGGTETFWCGVTGITGGLNGITVGITERFWCGGTEITGGINGVTGWFWCSVTGITGGVTEDGNVLTILWYIMGVTSV